MVVHDSEKYLDVKGEEVEIIIGDVCTILFCYLQTHSICAYTLEFLPLTHLDRTTSSIHKVDILSLLCVHITSGLAIGHDFSSSVINFPSVHSHNLKVKSLTVTVHSCVYCSSASDVHNSDCTYTPGISTCRLSSLVPTCSTLLLAEYVV